LLDRVDLPAADQWLAGPDGRDHADADPIRDMIRASHAAIEETERRRQEAQQRELDDAKALADERKRRLETARRGAVAMGAALVVLAGALVWAWLETRWAKESETRALAAKKDADEAKQAAEKHAKTATSRQLAVQAAAEIDDRLDLALLLSVEAVRSSETFEARRSLFQALIARPGLETFLHADEGLVNGVACSPDRRTLAAGFGVVDRLQGVFIGGGVVLWDVASRRRLADQPLSVPEGGVLRAAFSPDGNALATLFRDEKNLRSTGTVIIGVVLWDVASRRRLADQPLLVPEGRMADVAFSADGRTLAAATEKGVTRWDVASRRPLANEPLRVPEGQVLGLAFGPGGNVLAALTEKGVVLWDVASRRRLADRPLLVPEGRVDTVAFSPDGRTLAAGYNHSEPRISDSYRGGVVLWDLPGCKRLAGEPSPVPEGQLSFLTYSPDGRVLAAGYHALGFGSGFDHGGVVLWDAASRRRLVDRPLRVPEGRVVSVSFSADGRTLATGHQDQNRDSSGAMLWDITSVPSLSGEAIRVTNAYASALSFSPDGAILAAGYGANESGGVLLLDVMARRRLADQPLLVPEGNIFSVAFSPDGKTLAGAGFGLYKSGGVVLWDVNERRRLLDHPLPVPEGQVTGVTFDPDSRTLAAGLSVREARTGKIIEGGILLWDVASRRRLADQPLHVPEGQVTAAAFSPDGRLLCAGYENALGHGGLLAWDMTARPPQRFEPIPVTEGVSCLAFCRDGRILATGYHVNIGGGGVVLWDAATRRRLTGEPLRVPEGYVYSLTFSPDGRTLAAQFSRGAVLWDLDSRRRLVESPLVVPGGNVWAMSFSPDGWTLLAGAGGEPCGVMKFRFVPTASRTSLAGQIANRNFTRAEWPQYILDEPYRPTFPDLPVPPEAPSGDATKKP
jgi:WD40 repeat protein